MAQVWESSDEFVISSGYYDQTIETTVNMDDLNVYCSMYFPEYPNPGGTGFWRYMLTLQRFEGGVWKNVEQQTYNIACGQTLNHQFSNIAEKGEYMHYWIDLWALGSSLSNSPDYRGHEITTNFVR